MLRCPWGVQLFCMQMFFMCWKYNTHHHASVRVLFHAVDWEHFGVDKRSWSTAVVLNCSHKFWQLHSEMGSTGEMVGKNFGSEKWIPLSNFQHHRASWALSSDFGWTMMILTDSVASRRVERASKQPDLLPVTDRLYCLFAMVSTTKESGRGLGALWSDLWTTHLVLTVGDPPH